MKLNQSRDSDQSKCHFLTCGSTEHLWVKVGNKDDMGKSVRKALRHDSRQEPELFQFISERIVQKSQSEGISTGTNCRFPALPQKAHYIENFH